MLDFRIRKKFKKNKKIFAREVDIVRKNNFRREDRVKNIDENMVNESAIKVKIAEYFDGLINVANDRKARIGTA